MHDTGTYLHSIPSRKKRPSKVQNKIYDRFSVTLVISDLIDLVIRPFLFELTRLVLIVVIMR